MGKPDSQLPLFENLPDVREPAKTIGPSTAAKLASKKKNEPAPVTVQQTPVVLEPVVDAVPLPDDRISASPTVNLSHADVAAPTDLAPRDEPYGLEPGQLEAEELRRRNGRADRLDDRSNEYGKAFQKFAILYLAAKAGIPVYHILLAKLGLPPMDGTLVSAAIGIACCWHYSQMLHNALLAREHVYQFEIRFENMSGWGKFATILKFATTVCLFFLFAGIAFWTFLDIISALAFAVDYLQWQHGTTITIGWGR